MRLRYTPGYAPNSDLTQPCGGGTYEKEFFPLFSYKAKNLFLKENSRDLQSQQEAREMGACPKDFCLLHQGGSVLTASPPPGKA